MATEIRAIVRDVDGEVVNLVTVDAESDWQPPASHSAVMAVEGAQIGGTYDAATGIFTPPPEPAAASLEDVQAEAAARVDAEAGSSWRKSITGGSDQALAYEAKRREAEAWAAATSPRTLANYPFMRGRAARLNGVPETDATEAQMQAVADEWLAKIAAWRDAGVAIEAAREQAKEDIAAAADAAAVQAVLEGLAWPASQDGGD